MKRPFELGAKFMAPLAAVIAMAFLPACSSAATQPAQVFAPATSPAPQLTCQGKTEGQLAPGELMVVAFRGDSYEGFTDEAVLPVQVACAISQSDVLKADPTTPNGKNAAENAAQNYMESRVLDLRPKLGLGRFTVVAIANPPRKALYHYENKAHL